MGVVWRAVDERLERSVAVKKIVAQHGLPEEERANLHKRAMREAKIAARLHHPNAIVVFDITEHEGDPCLVMEYLPSHSLSELIGSRGTMAVPQVARIGEQVAQALVAAHNKGIVHRDVKPGNILIDEHGVAKLTDFGISRAQGDMTLTATGLIGGTPAYLAPELARGADPTAASDVFALGATLYQAIEGQSPFGSSTNQLALLHRAASGKVDPPRKAGAATALLMSMLRDEPSERISMREVAEKLAAIAAGGGVPAPPPPVAAERKTAFWNRTTMASTPATPAAAPTLMAPTGTAMFDAVPGDHAPATVVQRPRKPMRPAQPKERKRGGVVLAAVALLVAVGVLGAVFLNSDDTPNQADASGQTTTEETTSSTRETSETQQVGSGPIPLSSAGNLIVDYFSFPGGANASWGMLTPNEQGRFGDQDKFVKYWEKYDEVYAETVRGKYNDDGSVTMSATIVSEKDGKQKSDRKEFRVINSGGTLLIDSDTR